MLKCLSPLLYGKGGGPLSRVNFSARSYEKMFNPFAQDKSTRACSDCLAFAELTRLGEPKCLYREKLPSLTLDGGRYASQSKF